MKRAMTKPSRRDLLKGAGAAAPVPEAITPALIAAAKNESKVVLYSAMDLPVGEKLGKAFEAAYPGVAIQIERRGSQPLFQRIAQEFDSKIDAADVINSSDASHLIMPIISGHRVFVSALHPNTVKLFQAWLHTRKTQEFFVDFTGQYSLRAQVTSKPGRRKISDIKLMKEDPAGVDAMSDEIKTRYAKRFRV